MRVTEKVDEHLDVMTDLILSASDDFDGFVYGDSQLAQQCTRALLESGVGEFAPPHCRLVIDEDELVGMVAGLPGRELQEARFQMAVTLLPSGVFNRNSPVRQRSGVANTTLIRPADDDYYISKVAVSKNYRGKRLGLRLFNIMEKAAREQRLNRLILDVAPTHERAISFYSRFGFSVIDRQRAVDQHTGQTIEHLHMAKPLA